VNTINLPAGIEYVKCDLLAELICNALHPEDGPDDEYRNLSNRLCCEEHEQAIKQAANNGRLPLKNYNSRLPLTFLIGQAWKRGVVTIDDLRAYVADFKITVLVGDAPEQADNKLQAAQTLPADTEPAPVVEPDGITSRQVAAFFDGLPYSAENWRKRLSDTKWLQSAKIALGEVGGITGLWCPLILARLIHGHEKGSEQQKTLKALNSRFKRNTALQPWRDAWNEHNALFTDTIDN
jgi:hypothetical protein